MRVLRSSKLSTDGDVSKTSQMTNSLEGKRADGLFLMTVRGKWSANQLPQSLATSTTHVKEVGVEYESELCSATTSLQEVE